MKFTVIFVGYFLTFVFSASLPTTNLNSSPYEQLWKLQKLTNELKAKGNYTYLQTLKAISVDTNKLSVYIFTQSDLNGTKVNFTDGNRITELSDFSTDRDTYVVVHGWLDKATSTISIEIKDALLSVPDLNVIVLNWDACAMSINYLESKACVEGVGNNLGLFLSTIRDTYGYSLDRVTLVGHSLGAHICGFAGKYTNGTLATIVGLDPAGPFYFQDQKHLRLNEDDAQVVQAIHTSTILVGVDYNVGDSDFWPNGGSNQPGCGLDLFGKCSHIRSVSLYAESVISNDFIAKQCDSYNNFKEGKCDGNVAGRMAGMHIDASLIGDFYLYTNSEAPFGNDRI